MVESDLVVLGAGPAGVGAALAASRHGLRVALIDEAPVAGGQIYKAPPSSFTVDDRRALGAEHQRGARLRDELAGSDVETYFGRTVWLVSRGFVLEAVGPGGLESFRSKSLILATGTFERVIPFPGWTLPGVIGLGAATLLLKSQQMLPGRRTVVAGAGPLLLAVAAGVLKGGGELVAVVDLNGPADALRVAPRLMGRPDLAFQGMGWMARIRGAGVPALSRHAVTEVRGEDRVREVRVTPVDSEWKPLPDQETRVFETDVLAVGHGLVPATEVSRLLGVDHEYRADEGGWVATHDELFRTSLPGLYVAGDVAGIAGAKAAALRGELAGLAAAYDLGKVSRDDWARAMSTPRRRLRRAERFGSAMSQLMKLRPGLVGTITGDTVVCRCEDVPRGEIDDALDNGALELNQLKAWTRCGMGPCQGRMCGEAVASLLAARVGNRDQVGQWTGRAPLRPVLMEILTGEFRYEEIPLPPPPPR